MKRTKYIPAIVTLTGALAVSVIAIINRYDALHAMIIILAGVVGFYIAGLIIRLLAEKYLVIEEEKDTSEEEENDEEKEQENNQDATNDNADTGNVAEGKEQKK